MSDIVTEKPEPRVITEKEFQMLQQEKDFWRESSLLAEQYIDVIATAKSMQIKVREYNQFVMKRHKIDKKFIEVLQWMFDRGVKEKDGTQSLPDGK